MKPLKIRAYDNYNKQWLIIQLGGEESDEMHHTMYSSSNRGELHHQYILFSAEEGDKDNCSPKRWSDLSEFEIL